MRSRNSRSRQYTLAGVGLAATLWLTGGQDPAIAQSFQPLSGVGNPPQTAAQMPSPTASYLLFVNPALGNDSNNGNQGTPLRTISRALQLVQANGQSSNVSVNAVILLAPGTYSAETGEAFPLLLRSGITLQGDPAGQGQGIVIQGGGPFLSPTSAQQNIAILAANGATVTGVTLTNPNPRGYGLWIESSNPTVVRNTFSGNTHDGISMVGSSAPLVRGNVFVQNGANGISIYGTAQPHVQENLFERTGYGVNIAQNAAPTLTNNRILHNRSGVVVQDRAQPILQGNTIEGNREDGVVAIARSLPNLGTASAPGNNQFRDNGRYDINASSANQTIPAAGNQLISQRTAGRVDLSGAAPVSAAPVAASGPLALSVPVNLPESSTRPAIASATTPPSVSTRSTTSTGFANLPRLQATPPNTTAQTIAALNSSTSFRPNPPAIPSAPRPTVSISSSSSTAASTTTLSAAAFPNPTGIASSTSTASANSLSVNRLSNPPQPAATRPPTSQQTAIQIAVTPPPSNSIAVASNQRRDDHPIEIPVQSPPASPPPLATPSLTVAVRRSPQPALSPASRASQTSTSIPIPVIAPTTSLPNPTPSANPALAAAPRAVNPVPQSPVPQSNVLPVPSADIPVGHIAGMPTVVVSRNPLQQIGGGALAFASAPPAGLRYRVVVEAEDESVQDWVRSMVPGAFRMYANGRVMMQAGAYSDRTNADEAARRLTNSGLRAMVQQLQ